MNNSAGRVRLEFTYGEDAFSQDHTVYLRTHRDSADAEDELFWLKARVATGSLAPSGPIRRKSGNNDVLVRIDDAQEQTYVLTFPGNNDNNIFEGMPAGLELEAVPDRTTPLPFRVELQSANDLADYGLGSSRATSEMYTLLRGGRASFSVITESNDGDRIDDTVTVTAWTTERNGTQGELVMYELGVMDMHKLPKITLGDITVLDADNRPQKVDSIPEGKIGTVVLNADRGMRDDLDPNDVVPDNEKITVTLTHAASSSAARGDYTLNGSPVTIAAGYGKTGIFKLDVDEDEDIGEESLVLMATVAGDPSTQYGPNPDDPYELSAIPFKEATLRQIEARPVAAIEAARDLARADGAGGNELWEPGEKLTLRAAQLFEFATNTNVVLGNIVVENPAILSATTSNDMVTVTAMGDGTSEISITGTVVGTGTEVGPSFVDVTQTASNVVTVKFPITVDAPMITAKDNVQAVADAAVAKAAMESANGIWEPMPNGAMAMVALSDLFDVPESIEPRYLAESSADSVGADVDSSAMMVELTPMEAGMAMVTVTAVDTERPGNAVSVDFNVTVMAQQAIRAMSQDEVDAVFDAAGADGLVAQGPSISVDMSDLFEVASGVTPSYSAESSDEDVLMASASGMMLTLTPGQEPAGGMSTLTMTAFDRAGSLATVMFMATVADLAAALTITSDPMDMVEEGGNITVTAMLNQKAASDMIIPVEVTGPATPADTNILIMAGMDEANVMLMASDDHDPMSNWNDIVIVVSHEAIMGGAAVLTLSVTENDSEIDYTLSGPADMNVVEGMEYEIMAEASSPVAMDTMVKIMRDRAGSTAGDDDYMVDDIMIMAGETTGTTKLMVTEDNLPDGGTNDNMSETLVLFGMVGNMQTDDLMFYIWDAVVPALPVIAQLLLMALLGVGGYRRYLRR